MSLRTLTIVTICLIAPLTIGAEDVYATITCITSAKIHRKRWIYSIITFGILVGPVWLIRTEHAHLVAAIIIIVWIAAGCQSTIAHKQVIVATNILNIRRLATDIVSTGNTLAKIGIAVGWQWVSDIIVAQTCRLIQFQHKDAPTPRTVTHPEITLFVIKHTGVYIVWHTSLSSRSPGFSIAIG